MDRPFFGDGFLIAVNNNFSFELFHYVYTNLFNYVYIYVYKHIPILSLLSKLVVFVKSKFKQEKTL